MSRYFATKALFKHGSLFLSQEEIGPYSYVMREKEGRYFSKYPIGVSLVAVPFYWLGMVLSQLVRVEEFFATRFTVLLLNCVVNAMTCVVIFLFGGRMGFTQRTSFLLSFTYGIGSTLWYYSETLFAEPLQNLLIISAAYLLFFKKINSRNMLFCGILMGMAGITRLELFIAAPIFLLFIFLQGRSHSQNIPIRKVLFFIVPICFFLAFQLFHNYLRFDSIVSYGYEETKFSYPLLKGLYRALISSGKGFFIYNPVLLLSILAWVPFYREKKNQAFFFSLIALTYILFFSKLGSKSFSPAWGTRLLLILIPFLVIPLGYVIEGKFVSRRYRTLFFFLLIPSTLIQIPAVCVNPQRSYYQVSSIEKDPEKWIEMITFNPRYSPIVLQTQSMGIVFSNVKSKNYLSRLMKDAKEGRSFRNADLNEVLREGLTVNAPNFWWFYLYLYGFPSWISLGIPILLLFMVISLGIVVFRATNPIKEDDNLPLLSEKSNE
jgi:hypothetical protein